MVATTVKLDPAAAFALFTDEVDLWWQRGPVYRSKAKLGSRMCFEPGVGGKLVEIDERGGRFEFGQVLVWQPGERLVLEWRGPNFRPGERTEVEVSFRAVAAGTRVTIEHRGWQAIRPDHPARHGLDPVTFLRMLGGWWQAQLDGLVAL